MKKVIEQNNNNNQLYNNLLLLLLLLFNFQGVDTTHQLLAKYLSFKGPDVGAVELAERFYLWYQYITL